MIKLEGKIAQIQVVLTNYSSLISNVNVIAPIGDSDHNAVTFNVDINIRTSVSNSQVFNYKKGDYDKFRSLLSNVNWDLKFNDKNVNEMWDIFVDTIS